MSLKCISVQLFSKRFSLRPDGWIICSIFAQSIKWKFAPVGSTYKIGNEGSKLPKTFHILAKTANFLQIWSQWFIRSLSSQQKS